MNVVDPANVGAGISIAQSVANSSQTSALAQDKALLGSLDNFTDALLVEALTNGLDQDGGQNMLEVITKSATAHKAANKTSENKHQEASKANERVQSVARALQKSITVNAPPVLIQTATTALSVQKSTPEAFADSTLTTPTTSATVSVVPSMSDQSGRRSASVCSEISSSVNSWSRSADPHVYAVNELPRSGIAGMELYCDGTLQQVQNIPAGEEITICIELTEATTGARCMYHQPGGGLSDYGVATVGVNSSLSWPISQNVQDTVCCKASHLSDFVVVEGLHVTTFSPARSAINISKHTNIELNFSMPIVLGTGKYIIPETPNLTNSCR